MEINFGRSLILDLQAAEMITLAEHVTMSFGIVENVQVFYYSASSGQRSPNP